VEDWLVISSVWLDGSDGAIGSTVVKEGIPGKRDEELRIGKTRRITIAVRIIPLLRGAAF
jgi:hypothetical protein